MANKEDKVPFNLLYKVEAQKTSIDRLYEFATGAGRVIVIFVMLIIIGAFAYRFPLDTRLKDEEKKADKNVAESKIYLDNGAKESSYRSIISRIRAARIYTELYKDETATEADNVNKQVHFSSFLEKLVAIDNSFGDDVIITDYSFTSDAGVSSLKITGASKTFAKTEEYRQSIRLLTEVKEANIATLGASREGLPRFSLDLSLK